MTSRPLPRRLVVPLLATTPLLLPALLGGCAEQTQPIVFAPLSFAYLRKLRLNVANVAIDNEWRPQPASGGQHVEAQSPIQPVDALTQMARDRLVPAGTDGRATFVIDDASLLQVTDNFEANFAIHLDLRSNDGTRTGYTEARVSRTRTISDYSQAAIPGELYDLVKSAMGDMNVEFEYQVRKSLKDWLLSDEPTAPTPPPVQQQELSPPSSS
jgi:hypothetical protein